MSEKSGKFEHVIIMFLGSLMGVAMLVGFAFLAFAVVSGIFWLVWSIAEAFFSWQYRMPASSALVTGYFLWLIYCNYQKRYPRARPQKPETRRSINPNAAQDLAQGSAMRGPHHIRRGPPPPMAN